MGIRTLLKNGACAVVFVGVDYKKIHYRSGCLHSNSLTGGPY